MFAQLNTQLTAFIQNGGTMEPRLCLFAPRDMLGAKENASCTSVRSNGDWRTVANERVDM